ncbi:hypothetical protein TI39_contig374g00011 [Zymoseptoria brevis]|uniref:Uncharacterized protein n=1 Tax=Zymoseptoria brevis TaxID=1047168 RepID=A0A0F4GPC5_9PEZI|nr:hypothetical protein TI39_contig374g00011 [Zymoseptoria brevis]
MTGTANAAVSAGLGHLTTSVNVTTHYIGDWNVDSYSARVATPCEDQTESIPVAAEPFPKEAQHTKAEVTAACLDLDLDPAVQTHRDYASSGVRKRKRKREDFGEPTRPTSVIFPLANLSPTSTQLTPPVLHQLLLSPRTKTSSSSTQPSASPPTQRTRCFSVRMLSAEREFDLEELAHDYAVGEEFLLFSASCLDNGRQPGICATGFDDQRQQPHSPWSSLPSADRWFSGCTVGVNPPMQESHLWLYLRYHAQATPPAS